MDFVEYLELTGLNPSQIARALKISKESAYKLSKGSVPSLYLAKRLKDGTSGRVKVEHCIPGYQKREYYEVDEDGDEE